MALSGAPTPTDVAGVLAERGALAAGAAFANMAVFDSRTNRVRVVHDPGLAPGVATRWGEFSIDEPTPLCEAILTGGPVLLGSPEAIGGAYPHLLADTLAASLTATASLPLRTSGGLALGAVGFGWQRPQAFGSEQMARLALIAQMASEALERATLSAPTGTSPLEQAEARLLQEAFLPAALPDTDNLEVAAAYLPARDAALGGDWYDIFSVDGGTFLVIGDVAGHGLRSAAVMAQLRHSVRAFADEDPSPGRVLTRLNRMLCRLEPGETATAIVSVWDPASRTIVRSNVGHPPPLRCRPGEFSFLDSPHCDVILGAVPSWTYREETKVLRPGTTLLMYTDGLIESRTQGIDAGMSDLKTFVEGLSDRSPHGLCDQVVTWRLASGRREDDLCVLAARLT